MKRSTTVSFFLSSTRFGNTVVQSCSSLKVQSTCRIHITAAVETWPLFGEKLMHVDTLQPGFFMDDKSISNTPPPRRWLALPQGSASTQSKLAATFCNVSMQNVSYIVFHPISAYSKSDNLLLRQPFSEDRLFPWSLRSRNCTRG